LKIRPRGGLLKPLNLCGYNPARQTIAVSHQFLIAAHRVENRIDSTQNDEKDQA